MKKLRKGFLSTRITTNIIDTSLSIDLSDREDAIVIASCEHDHIDYLITRDKKLLSYTSDTVKIVSPNQFLTLHDG